MHGSGVDNKPRFSYIVPLWGWGYSENIPDPQPISLSSRSQSALVVQRWYTMLYISTLNAYADTTALLQRHKIAQIVRWEAAVSMLHQWQVFILVMIGTPTDHRSFYDITILIDSVDEVIAHLQAHEIYQTDMMVELVRLIKTGFNKSYRQVFTSVVPFCWNRLYSLTRTLTMVRCSLDSVMVPG